MAEERVRYRPEGRPFIWGAFTLLLLFALVGWYFLSTVCSISLLLFVGFFRDPERRVVFKPEFVLSPADGIVREIKRLPEGCLISIFMSLFDCHVNRSPHTGVVKDIHREGKGFKAAFFRGSQDNVKNVIELETVHGTMRVVQIAGLIARRIACWVKVGDRVEAGQRIGMIYFGSRVSLFLPGEWELFVKEGSRVKAGETLLGRKR